MNVLRVFSRAFAWMVTCAACAVADEVWTITATDFTEQRASLVSVDENTVRVRNVANETVALSWDKLLELSRGTRAAPAADNPDTLTLVLDNNDRIAGKPTALAEETLTWESPAVGSLDVSLRRVKRISRGVETGSTDPADTGTDVVLLSNGDRVSGIVDSLDAQAITISTQGTPTSLPWETVTQVRFAGAPSDANPAEPQRGFRLTLAGDLRVTARSVSVTGDQAILTFDAAAAPRTLPLRSVLSIEQINGPVLWLTALPPAELVHQPYFASTTTPPAVDRSVAGDPIRAPAMASTSEDRPARTGIGVASYSRLTWQLPKGYSTFRTLVAIDGKLAYANVVLRVKLDEKVVREITDFTAAVSPQLLTVPLNGAETLTLEVDYGQTLDVQDRVNWIEPALLK
jgi:hypothetical protein